MRRGLWIGALLLVGGGAVVAYVVSQLEYYEETLEVGYQGEAALNPLLAAERLCERLGLEARTDAGLRDLPPVDHTLVLRSRLQSLGPGTTRRTLEWVEGGGRLVVLLPAARASGSLDSEPPESETWADESEYELGELLEQLDLRIRELDSLQEVVVAEIDGEQFHVSSDVPRRLRDRSREATLLAGSSLRAWLLEFTRGAGTIAVAAEDAWATNVKIGELDHAALLWALVRPDEGTRGVVFVHSDLTPGLIASLIEHKWPAVVAILVLIGLYGWRSGARFGPLLPELPVDRRDFTEHVRAAASFQWRHGGADELLDAPRRDLERRIARARPAWTRLDPVQLDAELAKLAGLEQRDVEEARHQKHVSQPNALVRILRTLETSRNSL